MIQRIQSVYLALAIVLISIVTSGVPVLRFVTDLTSFEFSSFGIYAINKETNVSTADLSFPFYIFTIALFILAFLSLMSYKNLTKQLRIARLTFYLYLLLTVGLIVFSYLGGEHLISGPFKREFGIGYFLFVAGLPLCFLAIVGIKRDKALLDSLNRLR